MNCSPEKIETPAGHTRLPSNLPPLQNVSQDALTGLTALAECNSDGGILERQFLLLKGHVTNVHLLGARSLEGIRVSLRRIGGLSGEEHAAGVDSKVAEIINSGGIDVLGVSAPPSGPRLRFASSNKAKYPAVGRKRLGKGVNRKRVRHGAGSTRKSRERRGRREQGRGQRLSLIHI